MFGDGYFLWHQDSAPSHKAVKTNDFLARNNIDFIHSGEWIPKSPDACPLDYFMWGLMKRKLERKRVRTVKGLKRALVSAWNEIPQQTIQKGLMKWPLILEAIIDADGGHI